jgi:methyl acetate hydrolase
VRLILNRGKAEDNQVLRPETVDLMMRNNMGDSRVTLLKTAAPTLSNNAEFFPGMPKAWGLSFQIQYGKGADRPPGRRLDVGRAGEHVFLDRPVDRGWRHVLEPAVAVRRQDVIAALLRLRVGDL